MAQCRDAGDVHSKDPHDDANSDPAEDRQDDVLSLAANTADFLIVNDGRLNAEADPSDTHDDAKLRLLRALRERVDTGDYAVLPEAVAEAMVRRARDLTDEG